MTPETIFSPCRKYRYTLWRVLPRTFDHVEGFVQFIGLNPSTADETIDDPTIRRCKAFASAWGYTGLCMTNLFAFRATDPRDMIRSCDPVGEHNDEWLARVAREAAIVVAAWGAGGEHQDRGEKVRNQFANLGKPLYCLKITKHGHPQHPLYLKRDLKPMEWK